MKHRPDRKRAHLIQQLGYVALDLGTLRQASHGVA
jgi:predicted dinucleotide-binding enzyme